MEIFLNLWDSLEGTGEYYAKQMSQSENDGNGIISLICLLKCDWKISDCLECGSHIIWFRFYKDLPGCVSMGGEEVTFAIFWTIS